MRFDSGATTFKNKNDHTILMKIVLVKTPYLHLFRTETENAYPLGLAHIASILRASGFEVTMLDPENQGMDLEAFKKRIKEEKPDIFGIASATMNFEKASEFTKIARNFGAKTILGGIHATAAYQEVIKNNNEFDYVVFGEAEETIVELCTFIRDGKPSLQSILGLAYREKGEPKVTASRPFLEDLDKLPSPQWDLLNVGTYTLPDFIYPGKRGVTIVTARGCPAKCIFCSVPLMNGYKFRHFSAKRIVDDMETLVKKHNMEFIAFRDDTFTVSRQRVMDICYLLMERNIKVRWYCLARVNTVDQEMLFLMKKAGCEMMHYGVESADQKILNTLKKGINVQQIRDAVQWTHNAGIKIAGSFIFGNPGETQETMDNTLNLAIELDPDIAHFFVMAPLPGTELYEKYKSIYFDEDIGNRESSYGIYSMSEKSSFRCGDISYHDLKKQLVKATRKFYFRPHYIVKKMKQIRRYDDVKVLVHNGFALAKSMVHLQGSSSDVAEAAH